MAVDTINRKDGRLWDSTCIVHNGRKLSDILNAEHHINDIFLSFSNEDPSKRFGGKWILIAVGRTLVGVDPNDPDFNLPFKIGGSKSMQKHNHTVYGEGEKNPVVLGNSTWGWNGGVIPYSDNTAGSHVITDEAGDGDSGNLQPFITCYIWYRIS